MPARTAKRLRRLAVPCVTITVIGTDVALRPLGDCARQWTAAIEYLQLGHVPFGPGVVPANHFNRRPADGVRHSPPGKELNVVMAMASVGCRNRTKDCTTKNQKSDCVFAEHGNLRERLLNKSDGPVISSAHSPLLVNEGPLAGATTNLSGNTTVAGSSQVPALAAELRGYCAREPGSPPIGPGSGRHSSAGLTQAC